jgi:hypothetical protein
VEPGERGPPRLLSRRAFEEALRLGPAPPIGKGTVPLALRIFTLALLLGWQAVASGVGLAHFCPKQATATSACACPHGEKKAQKASYDGETWRKDCCDALDRDIPAPALVDVSSHAASLAVPPTSTPVWLNLEAPQGGSQLSLALWDTPHAQGPPVFLRIRSLLI